MAIDPNLHHTIIIPDMPKTFEAEMLRQARRVMADAAGEQYQAYRYHQMARNYLSVANFRMSSRCQEEGSKANARQAELRDLADFLKLIASFEASRREGLEAQRQEMQEVKQRIAEGNGKTLGDLLEEALDELVSEEEAKHAVKH